MNRIVAQSLCLSALTLMSQAVAPTAATAQPPSSWSVAGAGCVPTGQTASGPGTFNSAGDSKFAAAKVGEIILTCPVPSSLPRAIIFAMTYRDPDGPGQRIRVRAVLRQKELASGAISDVAWARLDSASFPPAPTNKRVSTLFPQACSGAGFKFDHDRFTYYVQVNMGRTTAAGDVLLASVDLGNQLIC
jgi:hypothetical protein